MPMDPPSLARAANENVIASFDRLRTHYASPRGGRRRFGGVEAIAVGHPSPFFNPVLALDAGTPVNDVLAAMQWVESLGLPVSVVVDANAAAAVAPALTERGFEADEERPAVMTLRLEARDAASTASAVSAASHARSNVPADLDVRVGGVEVADAWWTALEATDGMRALFGASLLADPDVRIAVADHDDEPAAGAMAIRSGDVLGVYAVWTVERARRRGLGRAVTDAVIQAGIDAWESRIAILHATEMGFPVYRSLGFEEIGRVVLFRPPQPPIET